MARSARKSLAKDLDRLFVPHTLPGSPWRGIHNPKNRLIAEQVLEIRRRARTESQASLAREFGVTQQAIWRIVHRQTWAWLQKGPGEA